MQLIQTLDRTPFGYERIQVTSLLAIGLSAAFTADSRLNAVYLTIEDNSIRYRIDGDDPDADNGHLVYATQSMYFVDKASIRNLSMLGIGGNAYAIVTYYI